MKEFKYRYFFIYKTGTGTWFLKIRSGMFIPDLEFFPSRILNAVSQFAICPAVGIAQKSVRLKFKPNYLFF
jgi:hypothetical protein